MTFYDSMPLLRFLVLSFIHSGDSLWIGEEIRLEKVGLRAHAQAQWASLVNFACVLLAQMAKSLPTETFLLLLWCPLPTPSGLCSQFSTHRLLKHNFPLSHSCGHNPLPVVTPFSVPFALETTLALNLRQSLCFSSSSAGILSVWHHPQLLFFH